MGVHLLIGIHPTEQQGRSPTGLPEMLTALRPKLEKYTTLRWNILGNSLPLCTYLPAFIRIGSGLTNTRDVPRTFGSWRLSGPSRIPSSIIYIPIPQLSRGMMM